MLGVESNDALTGGAGGGLDANTLGEGLGQQSVGVCFAQVVLGEEGELMQVSGGLDVVGGHALFFHLLAIVGDIVPDMLDLLDKALILPSADLFG